MIVIIVIYKNSAVKWSPGLDAISADSFLPLIAFCDQEKLARFYQACLRLVFIWRLIACSIRSSIFSRP